MTNKRKTVGAHALELQQQKQEKISVIEQQEAMTQDYMKNLFESVDRGYTQFTSNFYVTVITKTERLMQNVIRNYFATRESCPTPDYDQTVFRYNRELGQIEYIWTIPSKESCLYLLQHRLEVANEEKELLGYVLAFDSGKLGEVCKKLNNEQMDSPLLNPDTSTSILIN